MILNINVTSVIPLGHKLYQIRQTLLKAGYLIYAHSILNTTFPKILLTILFP